jgi:hypothetical protein
MRQLKIELEDISDITRSISDYQYLPNIFTQLTSGEEREELVKFWNEKVVKREKDTWLNPQEINFWYEINLHVVKQTWGNTSGGWQGMGGSAMTSTYTVIIENNWYDFACIYYSGKLAYICEMDDQYKEHVTNGYRTLPGCGECRKKLTVIYKSR